MKCGNCLLFALVLLVACRSENDVASNLEDADLADAAPVTPDAFAGPTDEEIMANYEEDVNAYQEEVGMSQEWNNWMLEREDAWSKAYINGRRDHNVHVYVRYEREIAYNPPWLSEDEHFAILERLAELQYPGWDFTFSQYEEGVEAELDGNDIVAVLGHSGVSSASGHTIYLVWEGIFGHEFGHTLGLHHHYCGGIASDHCPENFPPGESKCIMARDAVSFGPTENSFLLLTTGERQDDAINAIIADINGRYPEGYGNKPSWNECGMDR